MSAGDEEIARSATPRFALEAVLIRLANLPQALPVAELLTRLERLEGRVAGGVRPTDAVERSKPVSMAQPVVSPAISRSPEAAPASDGDTWREFIAFVGREKKFLASHLGATVALSLPPAPLKVSVAERHHLAFLQDTDNLASLQDLAKQFFAQEVTIQFVTSTVDAAPSVAVDGSSSGAVDDRSEMVKEALRIFGGAVRSVRRENT